MHPVLHQGDEPVWLVLGGEVPEVFGYTDADWGGDQDNCCSISAYVFKLGNGAISWKSKKQSCIALSLTEAEYMAYQFPCRSRCLHYRFDAD